MGKRDPVWGNAHGAERVEYVGPGRPELKVADDGGARSPVCLTRGLEHPVLGRGDAPVADPDLDHPGPHLSRHLPRPRAIVGVAAFGEVADEQLGEDLRSRAVDPVLRWVVRLLMDAGGEHDLQARAAGDLGDPEWVATQPDWGQLDQGVNPGRTQHARLGRRPVKVVELVATKQR